MLERLSEPWPWYVGGPLIGLMVPALLLLGGRLFGVSSNLRHLCAALAPGDCDFLRYDWRRAGGWNLLFAAGIVAGGWLAVRFLPSPEPLALAAAATAHLQSLGLEQGPGLAPPEIFELSALASPRAWIVLLGGGFLVGFGARWAGGCTSGHAISGLAALQLPSLLAVLGFFVGGLISAHFLIPLLF